MLDLFSRYMLTAFLHTARNAQQRFHFARDMCNGKIIFNSIDLRNIAMQIMTCHGTMHILAKETIVQVRNISTDQFTLTAA
jgi:hypothetical protein